MQFVRNGASPISYPSTIILSLSTHPSSQPIASFLPSSYPFLRSLTTTSNSLSIPQLLLSSQAFNHSSSLLYARASAMGTPNYFPNPPSPPSAPALQNLAGLLIQQFDIVRVIFFEIRRNFFEIWSIL